MNTILNTIFVNVHDATQEQYDALPGEETYLREARTMVKVVKIGSLTISVYSDRIPLP